MHCILKKDLKAFKTRIPRHTARDYGEEVVGIIRSGCYPSTHSRNVDISESIQHAVAGTVSYPPDVAVVADLDNQYDTILTVENTTSLSPVAKLKADGMNPVVLNFASATSPGGGFLNGARVQEEYLCRSSALYACLKGNPMYDFHRARHDALYTDYVIYSPDVPVFRDDDGNLLDEPYAVSVITSPPASSTGTPPSFSGRGGAVHLAVTPRRWQIYLPPLWQEDLERHTAKSSLE